MICADFTRNYLSTETKSFSPISCCAIPDFRLPCSKLLVFALIVLFPVCVFICLRTHCCHIFFLHFLLELLCHTTMLCVVSSCSVLLVPSFVPFSFCYFFVSNSPKAKPCCRVRRNQLQQLFSFRQGLLCSFSSFF